MNNVEIAGVLAALANEHRIAIVEMLVEHSSETLTAASIGRKLGVPLGSLAFHLRLLQCAGLVRGHHKGRRLLYSVDLSAVRDMTEYLCAKFGTAPGTAEQSTRLWDRPTA
jgi:DNA-binding transcriptional ArsR family regulator